MTPETSNSILLGIVSGLITTAFLWLMNNLWVKTIVPWYERRVYKGVNIQGAWDLVDDSDQTDDPWGQHESLDLQQTAHRLKGTATLIPKKGEKRDIIALNIEGDISDRFVSLTLRSPTQNRLSYSVLLLEIVADGNKLRGCTAMYDVSNEKISTDDVEYKRRK